MRSRAAPKRGEGSLRNTMQQSSTIISAAALQDHLARSITLDVRAQLRAVRPRPKLPVAARTATQPTKNPVRARDDRLSDSTRDVRGGYRAVWVCESCTFENDEAPRSSQAAWDRQACAMCGSTRVDKRERAPLTLAQRMGLVSRPPPKLSSTEWERCEQQAEQRGDTAHPCSICRELFGVKEQVILSCSHMFHLDCITSFERFLRAKQRVCPLCRKQDYQKRATTRAAVAHRERSAQRIQALVRGVATRKLTASLWHQFYSSGRGDPARRRRFLADRVGQSAHRLVAAMQQRDDSIDALLAEFDRSIRMSRRVFQESGGPETDHDPASKQGDDWAAIYQKARVRDEHECAICLNAFEQDRAGAALLSCSHVFHAQCLGAFEGFNIYELPLCPVCRASYRSRPWRSCSC